MSLRLPPPECTHMQTSQAVGPGLPLVLSVAPVVCFVFLGSNTWARMCIHQWVAELKPHIPRGSDLIAALNEVPAFPGTSPFFLICALCLYK